MKDYIIKSLLSSKGEYVSGESLCEHSGVTRSAVWKYISALRDEGFEIEAGAGKGYLLKSIPDVLSQATIEYYTEKTDFWKRIIVLNMVDSTNLYVRSLCNLRVEEGTAVFASCQTDGRGRRGRMWQSPDTDGVYMSVLFTPDMPYAKVPILSLYAAMAVRCAIYDTCGLSCDIKWPNDLQYKGKKLCGILCEVIGEINNDFCCIVGIGINANNKKRSFEKDIRDIATSIYLETGEKVDRCKLGASVLNHLERLYKQKKFSLEEYKKYCVTLDKDITVIRGNNSLLAHAVDISPSGGLLVKTPEGKKIEVNSGEVSIRPAENK
ncbi:MAG: biotin--[Clostridia bacterium]|nr:biotin--[acetyl-CoA-carboxylase] ligase [Clostridia bacterium]